MAAPLRVVLRLGLGGALPLPKPALQCTIIRRRGRPRPPPDVISSGADGRRDHLVQGDR